MTGRRREPTERSPAELETDWRDLSADAAAGYAALGRLVSSPKRAVAFLEKQLQSIKPVDSKRIERLIADLDYDQFEVREKAARELEVLAEQAAPWLRKALVGKPSLEVRRRLEALLDRLDGVKLLPETVRQMRAVEALEAIGSPEARRLLDKLAAGPAETRLTQEAKAAVRRLVKNAPAAYFIHVHAPSRPCGPHGSTGGRAEHALPPPGGSRTSPTSRGSACRRRGAPSPPSTW
jgi:hypothetical protein